MTPRSTAIAALLCVASCTSSDGSDRCELSSIEQAVLAEDRNILGAGSAYPGDKALRGRANELHRSQRARREAAWDTIAKVLAPVALNQVPPGLGGAELPRFQTWYGRDDVRRLFQRLVEELPRDQLPAHPRFEQARIDEAFGWNVTEVEELENWPLERREAYLAAIDSQEKLAGIGGIAEVSYSPAAVRHILRSYPEVLACQASGVPGAVELGTGAGVQQAERESVALGPCESRLLGSFFLGAGEELDLSAEGDELEGLVLEVLDAEGALVSECDAGVGPCTVAGEGKHQVVVRAGDRAVRAVVDIRYGKSDAPFAACLESVFPSEAVVVKASWHRAQFGIELPVYDTDGDALRLRLASNADEGWGSGQRLADPGPDEIYSVELPNGQRYRLAGLHIMSKELDHWQWVSLWWSDRPDSDFGEDRPAEMAALGAPWEHYKMCTATFFDERDPAAGGDFAGDAPSLAAALAAVNSGVGAPSWCSNPYIEDGAHNMATNCIGCHQHGGTSLRSEEIIGTEERFPSQGREQERNNFPHDYAWAIESGDELGLGFKEVIDFYTAE